MYTQKFNQPYTTNKAIIQLCSINGQHCCSKVSTIYTSVYKNIGNKIHLGLVKRCHSKAVHNIRKVFTILGKKSCNSLLPMPFINFSLTFNIDVMLTVCEPHILFLALYKIPVQKYQANVFYGFTHTSLLVAFNL